MLASEIESPRHEVAFSARAPARTAAYAHASARFSAPEQKKPTTTSLSSGTSRRRALTKSYVSSGVITPAVSQSVMQVTPASAAVFRICRRNAGSLRVASAAMNSTSSVRLLHSRIVFSTEEASPAGFICSRYSIWTELTGATTCRRADLASLSASQVI